MDVGALAHSQTEFVLNLYKAVAKGAAGENAVLSPLSVSLALAMVAAGAKGATLEQMATCLKLPRGELMHKFSAHLKDVLKADASKHGLELSCANSLWVDETVHLKPSFQKLLKSSYGAEAAPVDFQHEAEEARDRVNKWAEDETHGKIANVLPPGSVSADTRMILANAVYFKGAWKKPFYETSTEERDFFLPNGKTIHVPMMQTASDQYVKSYPSFKALRLPYKFTDETRSFSMFVLLPHERNGLHAMEQSLNTQSVVEDLTHLERKIPMRQFQLPKFKISFGLEISETLKSLGMELPFDDQHADLTDMTDSQEPLKVNSVRHKAFVEVNEMGTEAAAVTTIEIVPMCLPMYTDDSDFVADHPFMFLIKEESTNTILFTGRVIDPSKEQ
jgi:serpin B